MASEGAEVDSKSMSTKFLEAAKDFSFDQKLSVIQSILAGIPREQQAPWNGIKLNSVPLVSQHKQDQDEEVKSAAEVDHEGEAQSTMAEDVLISREHSSLPQEPPLIDPYEKSMRYYEKHLVLNRFQHMTAKLVLERPENTLQFMIDWCKGMQEKQADLQLKSKTLFEQNKIDVYDDDNAVETVSTSPKIDTKAVYGNSSLSRAQTSSIQATQGKPADSSSIVDSNDTVRDNSDSGIGRVTVSLESDILPKEISQTSDTIIVSEDEDTVSVSETSDLSA